VSEKDPAARYQQADEVRAALEAIAAGTASPWVAWRYRVRRRPLTAAAAALVALMALGVGANVGGVRDRLAGTPPPLAPIKLAVLPFENLTGDPEQEYLSDGLTDEMIGQLGRLHPARLSVIARTSSMRYKDRVTPLDQIGRELGVDYLLEGSARREGSRLRINATLIHVSNQTQRWSDSFDRELESILSLQHDVARGVAGALALALLPDEERRLATIRQVNPAAHEAYLKGRFHWYRFTPEDFSRAQAYFEEALRIDPDYALAHIGLADALGTPAHIGLRPAREVFPGIKVMVERALELDDRLAAAHDLHARILFAWDWDWAGAEAAFQRAIELNPNYPDAHVLYGQLLRILGRHAAARASVQRGLELDPYNAFFQQQFAEQLVLDGQHADAIARMEALLTAQPGFPPAHGLLWMTFFRERRYDEALPHARPDLTVRGYAEAADVLAASYPAIGYAGAMRRAADAIAAQSGRRYVSPLMVARLYAHAGDDTDALAWLERAVDERDTQVVYAPWVPSSPRCTTNPALLRSPTVSATHIAFAYANNIWVVGAAGGAARRLTSFQGQTLNPRFSPDGQSIAFSAEYAGNTDVYVVPVEGGEPRGSPGTRRRRGAGLDARRRARAVHVGARHLGAERRAQFLDRAGRGRRRGAAAAGPRGYQGKISPDGTRIAYRMNNSWDEERRNYRGGQNRPIWIVDLKTL
jgi:TolB-like protein/Tfp pilus assembly protein PilF